MDPLIQLFTPSFQFLFKFLLVQYEEDILSLSEVGFFFSFSIISIYFL